MKLEVLFTVFSFAGFAFNVQAATARQAEQAEHNAEQAYLSAESLYHDNESLSLASERSYARLLEMLEKLKGERDPCDANSPIPRLAVNEALLQGVRTALNSLGRVLNSHRSDYFTAWDYYLDGTSELSRSRFDQAIENFNQALHRFAYISRELTLLDSGYQVELGRLLDIGDALKEINQWLEQRKQECPKGISAPVAPAMEDDGVDVMSSSEM